VITPSAKFHFIAGRKWASIAENREASMYKLYVGDRAYSSWSLRGYLLLEAFGLPYTTRVAEMQTEDFDALKREIAPGRLVPTIMADDIGHPVWESLAIAETLHERHPEAGIWPEDPSARAAARSLAAEMHSGFSALRNDCPMNLRRRYRGFQPSDAVRAEVARAEELWAWARARWSGEGAFLFGRFTAADAFYAPLATRLATYRLEVSADALAYMEAIHAHLAFRRWRAMALATTKTLAHYEFDLPSDAPFGPAPRPAKAVVGVAATNAKCPYSGKPVAADSLAEIDGRVIGFCNTFCRDKSVPDADAWPKLAPLLG
jgi:glutathione S-transferase